jgi:hypothetical protein
MSAIRIVLTALAAILYWGLHAAFKTFYSPITGVATARTVNDSPVDYGFAKFLRDGGVESLLFYLFLFALLIIWIKPVLRLFQSNHRK